MAKSKWTGETDPKVMLDFLESTKATDRKFRLYAAALCRAVWPLLTHERSRRAVQIAEDHAEGQTGSNALDRARGLLKAKERTALRIAVWQKALAETDSPEIAEARAVAWAAAWDAALATVRAKSKVAAEQALQAVEVVVTQGRFASDALKDRTALLRCIFHNPYFATTFDPEWQTPTVRELAKGIDAEHAYDRMPMLADALEEAGCEDAGILLHARSDGPHAKGCWVIDAILEKV